jgi:hypothetical protein
MRQPLLNEIAKTIRMDRATEYRLGQVMARAKCGFVTHSVEAYPKAKKIVLRRRGVLVVEEQFADFKLEHFGSRLIPRPWKDKKTVMLVASETAQYPSQMMRCPARIAAAIHRATRNVRMRSYYGCLRNLTIGLE